MPIPPTMQWQWARFSFWPSPPSCTIHHTTHHIRCNRIRIPIAMATQLQIRPTCHFQKRLIYSLVLCLISSWLVSASLVWCRYETGLRRVDMEFRMCAFIVSCVFVKTIKTDSYCRTHTQHISTAGGCWSCVCPRVRSICRQNTTIWSMCKCSWLW